MSSIGPPGRPSLPSTPNSAFGLSPAPSPGPQRLSSASFPQPSTFGFPLPGSVSKPLGPPPGTFARTPGSSLGPSPAPSPSPLPPSASNVQFTSQANPFTPLQQSARYHFKGFNGFTELSTKKKPIIFSSMVMAPSTFNTTSASSALPPTPSVRPSGPPPNVLNGGSLSGTGTPQIVSFL